MRKCIQTRSKTQLQNNKRTHSSMLLPSLCSPTKSGIISETSLQESKKSKISSHSLISLPSTDILLNKTLMKKCLDLYAIVDSYESKPCNTIPAAVRHAVWIRTCGRVFESTCSCCQINSINVFNFHCSHIKAKSKGGSNHVSNFIALCVDCNLSMGTNSLYSFKSFFSSL